MPLRCGPRHWGQSEGRGPMAVVDPLTYVEKHKLRVAMVVSNLNVTFFSS
jgi:hypothetical protein